MSSTISLTLLSQTKMAIHSARHGFSPIHGILIGHRSPSSFKITDVIPVCHEVPTRPLVNTALLLADIYLQDKKEEILGWYTANSATGGDEPNVSALKVVSSIAEQRGEDMILVLVSAEPEGPLCTVFEKGNTKTFNRKVDASRIETEDSKVREVITRGITDMSNFSSEYGGQGLTIYDYVDHVSNFEQSGDLDKRDWIENKAVVEFVARLESR